MGMVRTATALLAAGLLWLGPGTPTWAETVELTTDGIRITADYQRGADHRPAVILLHGFLQTRYATTIPGLKDSLAAAGHSVLAPTLSLGIDNRRQSLACEAVHTHSMADDVEEIALWVDWLRARGHRSVVLVGHSFGSLHVLAYLMDEPDPAVVKAVATSLVDLEHAVGASNAAAEVERARAMVMQGEDRLATFEISYCKRYVAPPAAFLSYGEWSKHHILDNLANLPVPLEVVMGGNDQRMDADWPELLSQHGVQVATVDGANHFFDGVHEFELAERILQALAEESNSP